MELGIWYLLKTHSHSSDSDGTAYGESSLSISRGKGYTVPAVVIRLACNAAPISLDIRVGSFLKISRLR